jgi:hypothetical protein
LGLKFALTLTSSHTKGLFCNYKLRYTAIF